MWSVSLTSPPHTAAPASGQGEGSAASKFNRMRTFHTPLRKLALLDNAQLVRQYTDRTPGPANLDGAAGVLPPVAPGLPPLDVLRAIRQAVLEARPDLTSAGVRVVRLRPLPGNAVGLNPVQEPHVIYLDPMKIAKIKEGEVVARLRQRGGAGNTVGQRLQSVIEQAVKQEAKRTILHEDQHERDYAARAQQAARGGPLNFNISEAPAEAAESRAGPDPTF